MRDGSIAHRRGGREARLTRDGIREHDAFLGHEMGGPAGTGRDGVSLAGLRQGQAQGRGKGLPSPTCFFLEFTEVFGLSVSMK